MRLGYQVEVEAGSIGEAWLAAKRDRIVRAKPGAGTTGARKGVRIARADRSRD